jgi:hypothetical protein
MSTELKSSTQGVELLRFAGGRERGACLHISTKVFLGEEGNTDMQFIDAVSITREQAKTLAMDLMRFALSEEESDEGSRTSK